MERANRTIYDRIRHCEVMTIQEIVVHKQRAKSNFL